MKPNPEEVASVIDTSKMNEGQRAALEMTEAARDADSEGSFAGGLFMGRCDLNRVFPFRSRNPQDRIRATPSCNAWRSSSRRR